MKHRSLCIAILQLVDALAATACLTARSPSPRSFTIEAPEPKGSPNAGGLIVAVARVEVAPEYSGEAFVYQTRDHELVRDPYARFVALPSSLLATAIRGYLANTDFLGDVVSPGSQLRPPVTVEASALKLVGTLRSTESSSLLTIRFRVIRNGRDPTESAEIFLKTYSATSNNPRATAKAVADGWNKALADIMKDFASDLRASLTSAGLLSGGPAPTPEAVRSPARD
jgi:hypothetical protein